MIESDKPRVGFVWGELMAYQCVLCKHEVNLGDPGLVKVSPAKPAQGAAEPLYCHEACFRRLSGEAAETAHSVPPFTSARQATDRIQDALAGVQADFAPEEIPLIEALLADLARDVELYGEQCGVWDRLLAYPRGRWVALAEVSGVDNAVYQAIEALDPYMKPREDILVTWVDDYYNRTRPFENNRLVLLALDSGYQWLRQLIIPIERPDRPNPGLIP